MSDETEVKTVENEWEDILGSGQLLRKVCDYFSTVSSIDKLGFRLSKLEKMRMT